LLLGVAVACGGSNGAPDASIFDAGGGDGGSADAGLADSGLQLPSFPLVRLGSQRTLGHPQLVTITFSGYPFESDVQALGNWIVGSPWLTQIGAQYGVGAGSNTNVDLNFDGGAPGFGADGGDARQEMAEFLAQQMQIGNLPQPAEPPDGGDFGDTVYMLYLPPGSLGANLPLGEHDIALLTDAGAVNYGDGGGERFVWAFIQATTQNFAEEAASHELMEAATDPVLGQGYALNDGDPWAYLGGEVGDLCFNQFEQDPDAGFWLQRIYSNAAASAGTNPCVPVPAGPYYNVIVSPVAPQRAVAGDSVTVTLTGWASGPAPDWSLVPYWAYDLRPFSCPNCQRFHPVVTLSQQTMGAGQQATMTLQVPVGTPSGAFGFIVLFSGSTLQNLWPILVTAQ
jgi:hypothetical protein